MDGLRKRGLRAGEEPRVNRRRRKPRRVELPTNVNAHFVATRADRGSDDGNEVGGKAAEFTGEGVNSLARHTGRQPAPARVRGSYDSEAPVREQERHAIGRLNREGRRPVIRNDDVSWSRSRPACRPRV